MASSTSTRSKRWSLRHFAAGVTLAVAPAAWATYDSGSTSSDILESCKDFGKTTEYFMGVAKPALEMTCNECDQNGNMSTAEVAMFFHLVLTKDSSGSLAAPTCSPNCPDISDLCMEYSVSSSSSAVTVAARCSTGSTSSPQCDTDANGSYNDSTCPGSTIDIANVIESPLVNNHLAACKDE